MFARALEHVHTNAGAHTEMLVHIHTCPCAHLEPCFSLAMWEWLTFLALQVFHSRPTVQRHTAGPEGGSSSPELAHSEDAMLLSLSRSPEHWSSSLSPPSSAAGDRHSCLPLVDPVHTHSCLPLVDPAPMRLLRTRAMGHVIYPLEGMGDSCIRFTPNWFRLNNPLISQVNSGGQVTMVPTPSIGHSLGSKGHQGGESLGTFILHDLPSSS